MKGIDPRARAIAKTAARKEGMTLGEWLNRVILDDGEGGAETGWDSRLDSYPGFGSGGGDDDDDALRDMVRRLTDRLEAAEHRSTLALTGVDQSVLALSRRLESLEDAAEEEDAASNAALSRLRGEHEALLDRIRKLERNGPSGDPQAMKALENTVGKLAGRLYETERDVRAELDNLTHKDARRGSQAERTLKTLTERVDEAERRARQDGDDLRARADSQDKRVGDALSGLQTAARSLQSRIITAERETHRAAEALTSSQERLDQRLRELETKAGSGVGADEIQRRFDALGRELADLIRETRADCARQIAALSGKDDDAGRLQHALNAAEGRLAQAETRQAGALTRIAEEVGRLSRAVDGRIAEAERRIEAKFSETEHRRDSRESRVDMEARLDRVRQENASAVRKIGEQVARLGESLSDRVSQAEKRSARAVEAAGERMAEVVEKLETRRGASEADLESRIRASEERTAQRIEHAMKGVHERLDRARGETEDALSPVQRAMTALADRLEAIERGGDPKALREAEPQIVPAAAHETDDGPDFSSPLPQPPGLAAERWEDPSEDPGAARDSFVVDAEAPHARKPAAAAAGPAADGWTADTRVEAASEPQPKREKKLGASADMEFLNAARKTVRANRAGAQWEEPASEPGAARGRGLLIAAGVLCFAAVAAAAGMLALEAVNGSGREANAATDPESALSSLFAAEPATAAGEDATPAAPPEQVRDAAPADPLADPVAEPLISPTVDPQAAPPQADDQQPGAGGESDPAPFSEAGSIRVEPVTLEAAARSGDRVARYQLAEQLSQNGAPEQAARLMARAAEQGVPAAMRRYGLMLQVGDGVARDLETARRWMVGAAEAGNILAMHEAGGMFINAGDAPELQAEAARWFEQGALHGVRDSQFNMALLYQEGFGVEESPADALAWFTIAANAGDAEAGRRAEILRGQLGAQARDAALAAAAGFAPRPADPAAQGAFGPQPWDLGAQDLTRRAQDLLGELGYDPGPADGVLGQGTREALARFQSDIGLTPGAPLTPELIARLERAVTG